METLPALLACCEGNPPSPEASPDKGPEMPSFDHVDVSFVVHLDTLVKNGVANDCRCHEAHVAHQKDILDVLNRVSVHNVTSLVTQVQMVTDKGWLIFGRFHKQINHLLYELATSPHCKPNKLLWCWIHLRNHKNHDDITKWKHFPCHWPFVRGIHRSLVNSPHQGQWHRALMFSFICAWTNSWADNRDTGNLRCHRAHYDVTVMHNQNRAPGLRNLMFTLQTIYYFLAWLAMNIAANKMDI